MAPQAKSPLSICITGASSGIGLATAEVFAEAGHALILGARRVERLDDAKAALLAKGASAVHVHALDVRDQASIEAFAAFAQAKAGDGIDVLCNNAGLALGTERVAQGDLMKWQTMLDTNVMGLMRVTHALLPAMIARGRGHLVMTGSIAGHQVYEGGSVYCASKHAVRAIAGTLRLELNGTGVKVTSVDPGMVNTEFSVVRLQDQTKANAVYKGMIPLSGRDVAECIFFAATRPAHVSIDEMIVMPQDQSSVYKTFRRE